MMCRKLLVLLASAAAQAADTLIELDYAKYDGVANATGVTHWLGMRFAAAPVGDLRFAPPQDPKDEGEDIIAADEYGKICRSTPGPAESNTTDEDCLFINVFAPTEASAEEPLPVYFYISGGGFNSISDANLDGTSLIEASNHSIVVVAFNCRVGLFGFLASAEVETDAKASVNNGLHDQRKALQWVQKYIHHFGGDPKHVTIGGASAGAASVFYHLTAYGGRDNSLFSAAAAESQSFATQLTVDESQYQYDYIIEATNCSSASDTLACLRSVPAPDIQRVNKNIPFPQSSGAPAYMYNVVLDGDLVPDLTYRLFAEGKFIKVPVIFGDDTNGGTVFVPSNTVRVTVDTPTGFSLPLLHLSPRLTSQPFLTQTTLAEQNAFLQNQFPYITPTILSHIDTTYPNPNATCPSTGCLWRKASDIYGDLRYMCPGLYISAAYASAGVSSWNYRYNVEDPDQVTQGLGVPHTVERPVIWGSGFPKSYEEGGVNRWAVAWMQGVLDEFCAGYDPNEFRAEGAPEWGGGGNKVEEDRWERLLVETRGTTGMEVVGEEKRAQCEYAFGIGVELKQR